MDAFTAHHGDLLAGSYDCVDRIVLNAYSLGHNAGGFRTWWRRWHADGDDSLDDNHLMRLAGRFARRVRGWAKANGVPVVDCVAGERKHRIAEDYLRDHTVGIGVFLVLVAKAPATVWKVARSSGSGKICNLDKTRQYVNHYSFHIMDPTWGHLTIKMSGHAPFGAQVILNGHEFVACAAHAAEVGFAKEGNCFTRIGEPERLAQIADTLSQPGTAGRLGQVIDAWIYTSCLCFGLDLAEQQASYFRYSYSVYQVEYSRNLLFGSGSRMERLFDMIIDRTRTRLDLPTVRTLFGVGHRPHRADPELSPRQGVVILRPQWNLTIFKVHFGLLTLKAYSKGERVLRFEAIVHNTKTLRTGRALDKFGPIVARLAGMVDRFTTMLDCIDTGFLPDGILDELPAPSQIGTVRVGGIDVNKSRTRAAIAAVTALALAPDGFSVTDLAATVHAQTGEHYTTRQAAYDPRKLRGKRLVTKPGRTRRYHVPDDAARTLSAILTLRTHVIAPVLAGARKPVGRPRKTYTRIDRDYDNLRAGMRALFDDLGIATAA
ncbi:MAG TPA: hypothetical protein VIU87_23380 [Mycobacterium sp.]